MIGSTACLLYIMKIVVFLLRMDFCAFVRFVTIDTCLMF